MDECIRKGSFQDLRVWQRSMELVTAIYKVTQQFPRDEIYSLTSQIRRAAISIPSNIAEGHGRGTTREFAMFLRNANGSLKELETQLILAQNLGFIPKEHASNTELSARRWPDAAWIDQVSNIQEPRILFAPGNE
jgi:four helix bundle protein